MRYKTVINNPRWPLIWVKGHVKPANMQALETSVIIAKTKGDIPIGCFAINTLDQKGVRSHK